MNVLTELQIISKHKNFKVEIQIYCLTKPKMTCIPSFLHFIGKYFLQIFRKTVESIYFTGLVRITFYMAVI